MLVGAAMAGSQNRAGPLLVQADPERAAVLDGQEAEVVLLEGNRRIEVGELLGIHPPGELLGDRVNNW